MRRLLWLVLIWFISFGAAHAATHLLPHVVAVTGGAPAIARLSNRDRSLQVGDELEYGSTIKTGADTAVTIEYPDRSLLAVGHNTEFELQPRSSGTQYNRLESGQVRALIEKPKSVKAAEQSKKPRFVIRTRSAVLGVRGTEFVMAVDPSSLVAQIHTLEGTVDVASNEAGLLSGQGTSVVQGNYISTTPTGLSPAQPFDQTQFLEGLKSKDLQNLTSPDGSTPGQGLGAEGAPGNVASTSTQSGGLEGAKGQDPQKPGDPNSPLAEQKDTIENRPPERRFDWVSFQLGEFFVPKSATGTIRAVTASWNPVFFIPKFNFLSVRGHLGLDFARDGSLYQGFLLREGQIFGCASLMKMVAAEMGWGLQEWGNGGPRGHLFTVNLALLLKERGGITRVFIGRSLFDAYNVSGDLLLLEQFKVGVGFAF